ncbi:MAG: hypothetical protein HY426_00165 [Candidatus Levybacteria bacterium]|nr:hypothetical protein [Candidatus Levybacteria bacterium]
MSAEHNQPTGPILSTRRTFLAAVAFALDYEVFLTEAVKAYHKAIVSPESNRLLGIDLFKDITETFIDRSSEPDFFEEMDGRLYSNDPSRFFKSIPFYPQDIGYDTSTEPAGYLITYSPKGVTSVPSIELEVSNLSGLSLDQTDFTLNLRLGSEGTLGSFVSDPYLAYENLSSKDLQDLIRKYSNESEEMKGAQWQEESIMPPIIARQVTYFKNGIPFTQSSEVAGIEVGRSNIILQFSSIFPLPEVSNSGEISYVSGSTPQDFPVV